MTIHNMSSKTPAERAEISRKAVATRRRNIETKRLANMEGRQEVDAIASEISKLKGELERLRFTHAISTSYGEMLGLRLAQKEEIVGSSVKWEGHPGVYFLIKDGEIVYIGQSINVFSRIGSHGSIKEFDSYSYVSVEKDKLDIVESLYIHIYNPAQNGGTTGHDTKLAPMNFNEVISTLLDMDNQSLRKGRLS